MISMRFHASYPNGMALVGHPAGMPCQGHGDSHAKASEPMRLLRTHGGRVAFWLLAGLFGLTLVMGGLFLSYRGGWIGEKGHRFVVALSREDTHQAPHRYKIEKPTSPSVTSGPNEPTGKQGMAESPAGAIPAVASGPVRPEQESDVSSRDSQPSVAEALPDKETASPAGDRTVEGREGAPSPSAKDTTSLAPAENEPAVEMPPKAALVKAETANVRDRPTMRGNSLFLVRKGSSVKVTAEEKGWARIQMDDGRSGWVRLALLSEAPPPAKEHPARGVELKAVRVEPPLGQRTRVFFRSSSSVVPEIQVLEGNNPRVVLDFPGATPSRELRGPITPNNGIIRTIRMGRHERPQLKLRVVLDLEPGRRYEARQVSSGKAEDIGVEIRGMDGP